jgi:hypothetical protein
VQGLDSRAKLDSRAGLDPGPRLDPGRALAWNAGLRIWGLGPRPLPGGFESKAALVADFTGTVTSGAWTFGLGVDNLLGSKWRDGEFVFPSRFDPTRPRSDLPVVHVTAGSPPAAHIEVTRAF